jgi:hypothetical protein
VSEIDMTSALKDEEIARQNIPHILHEGRYRLYGNPDGGLHLVYLPDGQEIEQHMNIPGGMIRLSQLASTGNLTLPQFMREASKLMAEMRRELYRARVT